MANRFANFGSKLKPREENYIVRANETALGNPLDWQKTDFPPMLASHAPTFQPPQPEPSKTRILEPLLQGWLNDSILGKTGFKLGQALKTGSLANTQPYNPDYQPQTFGEKALQFAGTNLGDAGLWAAGDAALAKPLGILAKTAPVGKVAELLPKAILPAVGTGVKAGATYAGAIAPAESILSGENLGQFAQREAQTPLMALGGVALHGGAQLLGKAIKPVAESLKAPGWTELAKAEELTRPKVDVNAQQAWQDVVGAYKAPTLNDVRQQEYNQIFSGPDTIFKPAPFKAENPSQYFKTTQADVEAAFGAPRQPKAYRFTTGEQRALQALQDGIQEAQNAIGHNDILAPYPPGTTYEQAFADIKGKTGVDLQALTENFNKSQQRSTKLQPERLQIGRAAGVIPELRPRDIFVSKPEPIQPVRPSRPEPRIWTNKDVPIQPKLEPKQLEPTPFAKSPLEQPAPLVAKAESIKPALSNPNQEVNIATSSLNWNNKPAVTLARETLTRIFEDVAGKDAPALVKKYADPIGVNEADKTRWLNSKVAQVKELGISGRKDSELLQKYGEKKITLEELKRETKNWDKITKAVDVYRSIYDEALDMMNKSLERNGYDPVPRREDYFPHFQEMGRLSEFFGIPDSELPTDINGLTADFKPGKKWFAHALPRTGDKTAFDALKGMDRYLRGAADVIFHTDDIQRLRSLENTLRDQYQGTNHLSALVSNLREYTNKLAGKKPYMDRGPEVYLGRRLYGAADRLRRQVGANMVGANVSSALTNFIPVTQALATTDKRAFVEGALGAVKSVFKDDGLVDKSHFLTRRIGADRLAMNLWDKAGEKAGWLFKTVDNFVAQVVVRSKYIEGIEKGLSPEEAMSQADKWASKMMADRSLGGTPILFDSKTLGFLTQFQLEVNNQLSFMAKDIPRNFNKAGAASALAQLTLYGYLFNNLYELAVGRRPAFDPIGVAQQAYEDYNNQGLDKGKATWNLVENVGNQLPFSSTFTGGRLPVSSVLPDVKAMVTGTSTPSKELQKLWMVALPTGGSQIKKTFQGIGTLKDGGVFTGKDKKQIMYPIPPTFPNLARGSIFGKNAFPESRQYWDNNRRPLTEKQTQEVLNADNPSQYYELIQKARVLKKIKDQTK